MSTILDTDISSDNNIELASGAGSSELRLALVNTHVKTFGNRKELAQIQWNEVGCA